MTKGVSKPARPAKRAKSARTKRISRRRWTHADFRAMCAWLGKHASPRPETRTERRERRELNDALRALAGDIGSTAPVVTRRGGEGRRVAARYDAAQTTDENRRHWANADALGANAANSKTVRATLRNRARYESANNPYCRGMVLTLANDVVGTGPRLQIATEDPASARLLEAEFAAWAKAARVPRKLRIMRQSQAVDGESFALLITNPKLKNKVKLDLRPIEADQVTTPVLDPSKAGAADGIIFDDYGNPVEYHVLRAHPGEAGKIGASGMQTDAVPADDMVHLFRADRPGQVRGIPELTPSLALFGQLRRYRQAVLDASENAARLATVMATDLPPEAQADEVPKYATMEAERDEMVFAPAGWKPFQIKAEHPSTQYVDYVDRSVEEQGRCWLMPANIARGNSSDYNFASGRLDHMVYFKFILVERSEIEAELLDRLFDAWLVEAVKLSRLADGRIAAAAERITEKTWFWPGNSYVNPLQEAKARQVALESGLTDLPAEIAADGRDWEQVFNSNAKALGISLAEYQALLRKKLYESGGGAVFSDDEEAAATALKKNGKGRNAA